MIFLAILIWLAILNVAPCSLIKALDASPSPAWNGRLLPGAVPQKSDTKMFRPYFVPYGDRSIDDASSLIKYSAGFRQTYSPHYVHQTSHFASLNESTAHLSFKGDHVEYFGSKGPNMGIAAVSIDGRFATLIDAYHPTELLQQRLFSSYGLSSEPHSLTVSVTGRRHIKSQGSSVSIDAFVVPASTDKIQPRNEKSQALMTDIKWSLVQHGSTGVAAMQLAIISDTEAIIIDKVEHNPLSIDGHPAWAALYHLRTHSVRPLSMKSNSFCAGGTWLSNGTLINVGGNPVVENRTEAADFGDVNGLQSVRMFTPCDNNDCNIFENSERIRLASARWYSSSVRLPDGSVMIIGGSIKGGWINNQTVNNPTIEYFPPKNLHGYNGIPIPLPFLVSTLNANLFPIAIALPSGSIFIAANQEAMIYDWRHNSETRLPSLPNGVRISYPMSGTGVLLPLSYSRSYEPEVLICGGSSIDDTRPGYEISSKDVASDHCSRMLLTKDGIARGWQVETMPDPRIMPDVVLLPTGKALIINGGRSGIAGYGNVKDQMGQSNAADPIFKPVLYDPDQQPGHRFSDDGLPSSDIPRLYHSVASLTPNGSVMIAGSNPNLDRSNAQYGTEYRVEWLNPPYMTSKQPTYTNAPSHVEYGIEFTLDVLGLQSNQDAHVVLMDLGFITHGLHMNSRMVILPCKINASGSRLTVTGPPSPEVYPPGPAWIYLVVDDIPSAGKKLMVGDGSGPPVDEKAIDNLLAHSQLARGSVETTDGES